MISLDIEIATMKALACKINKQNKNILKKCLSIEYKLKISQYLKNNVYI